MKTVTLVLAGLGLLVILLLAWGAGIEPRLIDEQQETAEIPGLPAAWAGQQVAVVADFQVGMWWDNTGTVRRVVARLVERRPAAVLIAGDFIYHPANRGGADGSGADFAPLGPDEAEAVASVVAEAVDLVRPLPEAGIPTYAVFGNHDYGMESPQAARLDWAAQRLREALDAAGIRVLRNEAVALPAPGEDDSQDSAGNPPLYLVGIGSRYAGRDRPAAALAGLPEDAPRIVMMHNPDSFDRFPAGTAPLAVAGHTHGGQIRIPFTGDWSWMALVQEDRVHVDGWIANYGGPRNRLYVNRGIGFSTIPVRIHAMPEITLFTLRPAGEGE